MTEREMLDLLRKRYTRIAMNANRYAYAEHVANQTGGGTRIADFMAIDCFSPHRGPRRSHKIHGHEVKVSRSDWLTELRDPTKAEAFKPFVHYWWLVVPDASIVKPGELPAGWGLMVKSGSNLRAATRAPLLDPAPMPSSMMAAWLRSTAKTASRAA